MQHALVVQFVAGAPARTAALLVGVNWPSNRVFATYDDIVAHCCEAWNKLIDHPWRIISIGMRNWAHRY